jgi:hypothetical protein
MIALLPGFFLELMSSNWRIHFETSACDTYHQFLVIIAKHDVVSQTIDIVVCDIGQVSTVDLCQYLEHLSTSMYLKISTEYSPFLTKETYTRNLQKCFLSQKTSPNCLVSQKHIYNWCFISWKDISETPCAACLLCTCNITSGKHGGSGTPWFWC